MHEIRILQILDDSSAIVRFVMKTRGANEERLLLLRNFPTAGLTTDREIKYGPVEDEIKIHPVIYVYGTYKWAGDSILEAVIVNLPGRLITNGFEL